jgi:hypothetical protein
MNGIRVELKVCEVCGALWLRAAGQGVYCRGCAVRLAEFPASRMRRMGRKCKRVVRTAVCAAGGAR